MGYMIAVFVIVFFSLYAGLNYYIGLRGWQNVGNYMPFLNSKTYWTLFWVVSASYIIARLFERYIPSALSTTFEVVGGYWMAIMMYLLIILPLIDLIRLLNRKVGLLPNRFAQNEKAALVVGTAIIIALIGLMSYGTWSGRSPKVSRYSIDINKGAGDLDTLKVVMASDVHLGSIIDSKRLSIMVDRINELEPDIVLLTGDIIDSKLEPFTKQQMGENFRRLKTRYGVYASLGNHEAIGVKIEEVVKQFEDAGITVLRDEAVLIEDVFYVAGRDDNAVYRRSEGKRKELREIVEELDKTKPILLMDHQPKELDAAQKEGVDLQVSGHTHRGQIFPGNLITSRIFEIDYGYLNKDNLHVVVSSGFGTWGPPIRIGSRSEIVEISINFLK
jgi:uncharacterized protein